MLGHRFEKYIEPYLKDGYEVITYVGIRYDERGRVGYKPTNPKIIAKFPFIDDAIDKAGVEQISPQAPNTIMEI